MICKFFLSSVFLIPISLALQISRHHSGLEVTLEDDWSNMTNRPAMPIGGCRTASGIWHTWETYKRDTCGMCYSFLNNELFKNITLRLRYLAPSMLLWNPITNETYLPDPTNISEVIRWNFVSPSAIQKWIDCCNNAIDCCKNKHVTENGETGMCPGTWDGWLCWPDTPAGVSASEPCPKHIYFLSEPPLCTKYAVKRCTENSTWFIHPISKKEWTNYSSCGMVESHKRRLHFHIATNAVSIMALIPALIIFMMYKQLKCPRITMHKNLFASLLLSEIAQILFESIVMLEEFGKSNSVKTMLEENSASCKVLFMLTKYFRMTNYMWMFCEGFYLHKLIAAAFAEQKKLIVFYIIGWAFPLIPIAIYSIIRKVLADERCWVIPVDEYEWTMNGPSLLSLVLNFAFLCNIIRVLVTKLRATHTNEPSQYRKAVRATLFLVPLFGLHFFLVIYRPEFKDCSWMEVYNYVSYAMDGLQGFLVALLFCYMNGEVHYLVKRSYDRYRTAHNMRGRSSAGSFAMGRLSLSTQVSSVAPATEYANSVDIGRKNSRDFGTDDPPVGFRNHNGSHSTGRRSGKRIERPD